MSQYGERDYTTVIFDEPYEYPVKQEGDKPKTINVVEYVHPDRMTIEDLHSIKSSEDDLSKYIIEAISKTVRNADTGLEVPLNIFGKFRAFHLKQMIESFADGAVDDPNI